MKKLLLSTALIFTSLSAFAGLSESFVAADGKVFQIATVLSVEKVTGFVSVKQATGSVQNFSDPSGTVWNRVLVVLNSSNHYVKVPNSNRWMNTAPATEISCISNQTAFGYPSAQPEWFQDACALHTAVKNVSN